MLTALISVGFKAKSYFKKQYAGSYSNYSKTSGVNRSFATYDYYSEIKIKFNHMSNDELKNALRNLEKYKFIDKQLIDLE